MHLLSTYLVVEMTLSFFLGVEDGQVMADGGELREDEGHREMFAKGDRELDPGHFVSVEKV